MDDDDDEEDDDDDIGVCIDIEREGKVMITNGVMMREKRENT